jgi:nitrous oxidase accessory protein
LRQELHVRLLLHIVPAAIVAAGVSASVSAETLKVAPEQPLQAVLDRAQDGDVIELAPGQYKGSITIDRRVVLTGRPGAALVGGGAGNVVTVNSPDVTIRGVTIRGSGRDLQSMDSGIFLEKTAERALVENNRFEGNLFGIYVHGAAGSLVERNIVEGVRGGRLNEAGNGVSLWNAPDVTIADNTFRYGRDGIFTIASRKDHFIGNRFEQVRFAVHYMYTNDSEVNGNVSVGNHGGYAIMFSTRLVIRDNISDRDRDYGLLFNYANYSEIDGNRVTGGPLDKIASDGEEGPDEDLAMLPGAKPTQSIGSGPEKCVFIYNANHNKFRNNWFEGCGIGVHFTAGSEGNEITGNAFVGNRNQVKYVGTRDLDWSKGGRGNYWSDNPAFDLNGDGIADTAYRPNDLVDRVLWTAPSAKVLINSPAVQVLRWAQAQFPALYPGGVVDTHPLIAPPPKPSTGRSLE